MRILSLNAWGGRLWDPLRAFLAADPAEVICLQEVLQTDSAPAAMLDYRGHGADLPQRARMFQELAAALPDHRAWFCPAAQGDLWDGATRHASLWGIASFVHHRLAVVGQAQGFVHGAFSADGYGAHPRPRTAHVMRLFDPGSGRMLTVGHMHGIWDPAGKGDSPARDAQARRFRALAEAVVQPGDTMVLCGDFNVRPSSRTFAVLAGLGLTELVTGRGLPGTRSTYYAKRERFADYMLVSPDLAAAPFTVVRDPEVSDHCPLRLTLDGG